MRNPLIAVALGIYLALPSELYMSSLLRARLLAHLFSLRVSLSLSLSLSSCTLATIFALYAWKHANICLACLSSEAHPIQRNWEADLQASELFSLLLPLRCSRRRRHHQSNTVHTNTTQRSMRCRHSECPHSKWSALVDVVVWHFQ